MKLVQTTVTEGAVHMRYADNADPAKATAWIDFRVPTAELKRQSETALGDPERRPLAEVRLAALRYARGLIGEETQRLSQLLDRIRE